MKRKSQRQIFRKYYILQDFIEAQKIKKPGAPKALFTTLIFVLKYASKPEVVKLYAF